MKRVKEYRSRFLSTQIARFTQPDTIVPNLYDPQSLNRYSYARNNPVNATDPTGHADDRDEEKEKLKKQLGLSDDDYLSLKTHMNYWKFEIIWK
jgi:hypothetical protein